jgi:hypothetical protein
MRPSVENPMMEARDASPACSLNPEQKRSQGDDPRIRGAEETSVSLTPEWCELSLMK